MNRYVILDLEGYGDDFRLLKIQVFFPYFYFRENDLYIRSHRTNTRSMGYLPLLAKIYRDSFVLFDLKEACQVANYELITTKMKYGPRYLHTHGFSSSYFGWYINRGLEGACSGSHTHLIDLMIEQGADDWDKGLSGACEGGHRDLVDLMIEKGVTCWHFGLSAACKNGHTDLVNLMIDKGAVKCLYCCKMANNHPR